MNPTEAALLARLARSACPQQHWDEYTPDIWYDLLSDLPFDDAREGLLAAVREKPFVAPAEIRAQVRKLRARRLANVDLALPPADPDARDYTIRLRQMISEVADGRSLTPALPRGRRSSEPTAEYMQARGPGYVQRRTALAVPCPVNGCRVDAGRPCREIGRPRRPVPSGYHQARLDAAVAVAEGRPYPAPAPPQGEPLAAHERPWCGRCHAETRHVKIPLPGGGGRSEPCRTCHSPLTKEDSHHDAA